MFTYGSYVKIIGGFYKGHSGTVFAAEPAYWDKLKYTILLQDGHKAEQIPELLIETDDRPMEPIPGRRR